MLHELSSQFEQLCAIGSVLMAMEAVMDAVTGADHFSGGEAKNGKEIGGSEDDEDEDADKIAEVEKSIK